MEYKVFSAKLAGKLIRGGFQVIREEPNMKIPKFTVWVFEKTEAFMRSVDDYMVNR